MITDEQQRVSLHTSALEIRGFPYREELGTECRRGCSLGHMLCGCATGRVVLDKSEASCVTRDVFLVLGEER